MRALLGLSLVLPTCALAQGSTGLKLSGYTEVSYTYSRPSIDDSVIVGRLYDRLANRFTLNALAIVLDKPHDVTKRSAGFHAEVLFGQNATAIKSGGGTLDLGTQGDIPHLYVTLNLPTANGNGVQLKVGRIPTLLGLEVIETVNNPNWSQGNQFIYLENFTGLGVSLERKMNPHFDVQFRVINGWDQVSDNNTGKSLMGRVGISPDAATLFGLVGFWGPEQTGNDHADRYGVEVLVSRKLGKAQLWMQGDYGLEQANAALADPTQDARWWGFGGWVSADIGPALGWAMRADYVNDEQGARTSGVLGFPAHTGQRFGSVTATLNVRAWPDAQVRPEVRYDRSTLVAFHGRKSQATLAIAVAYLF